MLPPTPAIGIVTSNKDPRPIRDKAAQNKWRSEIFNWLQESGFQGNLSKQTLMSPTAKDFRAMFEHLVALLDPTYTFGDKGKKFEDEFILALKALHYPYVDAINKSWLAAPASMHSWHTLTAMLSWITNLSKVKTSPPPVLTSFTDS